MDSVYSARRKLNNQLQPRFDSLVMCGFARYASEEFGNLNRRTTVSLKFASYCNSLFGDVSFQKMSSSESETWKLPSRLLVNTGNTRKVQVVHAINDP
jgi:hypothetical protein